MTESYLDRSLDTSSRIQKAWYAVFFLRYWRQWLLCSPQYTLGSNFVTTNAYICTELNAHSLVTYIMTVRDVFPNWDYFLPWMLGSQPCERLFRSARSMSSTFSTMVNFSLLGLLNRLHRLNIQCTLESEAEQTGIMHPRVETHKKSGSKDGQIF